MSKIRSVDSFDSFSRRAQILHRTTQIVDALAIVRPVAELMPGRAGRLLRAIASLDAKFAEQAFRFEMSRWKSFDSAWVRSMASDPRHIVLDAAVWTIAKFGGAPVVWCSAWNGPLVWCPLTINELLARARVEGPAVLAHKDGEGYSLRKDLEPLPETRCAMVQAAIAKTLAIPGCRSWLFVGPPGAGKTTAARQLVAAIGGGSFLTLGPDVAPSPIAWEVVHALRPAAIVVDDIDASSGESMDIALRQGLAATRRYARVIVGTANTLDAVRGSLIRPGRFDEGPLVFDNLDPAVAAKTGDALPRDVLARAVEAGLLAAYLHELNLRVRSGRDPDAELDDMIARMAAVGDR